MENIKEKMKKFFSKKVNLISTIVFVVILLVMIVWFLVSIFNKEKKFVLNSIYDVYPEEVRDLYSNMVEVSCYGDLHLDISLDTDSVELKEMKQNNLIDYMFSYLDKKDKLEKEFSLDVINDAANYLFSDELDFSEYIDNYVYGDYKYSIKGAKVVRENGACSSDVEYISHLYGYSNDDRVLSVDVNIGYLKDGILYNLSDEKLGKYDGNIKSLEELFRTSSYYRYNYVKHNNVFKLKSVEWNVRY